MVYFGDRGRSRVSHAQARYGVRRPDFRGIRTALSQAQGGSSFRPLASSDEIFALENRRDGHPPLV
jgi:hypothetical protein